MTDETTLLSCPFCSGEAFVRIDISLHPTQSRYRVGCDKDPNCHGWYGHSRYYATESEAIVAWNTRAKLGNGTCEIKQHRCTSCNHEINDDAYYVRVSLGNGAWTAESRHANFCPNCGAKVVGE